MTHEYRDSTEVLVKFPDVLRIVLLRLPLVHPVEVGAGIVGLGGLERSASEAKPSQHSTTQQTEIERTPWDRFATVGTPFRHFRSFQSSP